MLKSSRKNSEPSSSESLKVTSDASVSKTLPNDLSATLADAELFQLIKKTAGKKTAPKLPLTPAERVNFKHINKANCYDYEPQALANLTGFSVERCHEIIALCQFQLLGSVGLSLAQDLWNLGFKNLRQLAEANPTAMYNELSGKTGQRQDSCVEDVFRCAIAQVTAALRNIILPQQQTAWWNWTRERGNSEVNSYSTKAQEKPIQPVECLLVDTVTGRFFTDKCPGSSQQKKPSLVGVGSRRRAEQQTAETAFTLAEAAIEPVKKKPCR